MLAKPGSSALRWPSLIDVGKIGRGGDGVSATGMRLAPLVPSRMERELQHKIFTNMADTTMVAALYQDTFEAVIGGAVSLSYHGACWDDEQMASFCELLPSCNMLQVSRPSVAPEGAGAAVPEVAARLR